jgi:hypothetical protein
MKNVKLTQNNERSDYVLCHPRVLPWIQVRILQTGFRTKSGMTKNDQSLIYKHCHYTRKNKIIFNITLFSH